MEEDIEIRPIIELLLERWHLIIGAAFLAAVLAFTVSTLLPPEYAATAIVAITEPQLRIEFEPRIAELQEQSQPLKAFPELATSDQILTLLLDEIHSSLRKSLNIVELRKTVSAELGSDPTLVRLIVKNGTPEYASSIANSWAEIFVHETNQIYGEFSDDQDQFFINQLDEAEEQLSQAEGALIDFAASNRLYIVRTKLESLQLLHSNYLTDNVKINLLIQNIEGLLTHIESRPGAIVSIADQLSILSLQLQTFNAETSVPIQLQLDSTQSLVEGDLDSQVTTLAALIQTLKYRLAENEGITDDLEPQILNLQRQAQEIETESLRLVRDQDLASETYLALARKVEEESITAEEFTSAIKLASKASVPNEAESRGRLITTSAAAVSAAVFAALAILVHDWWKTNDQAST